MQITELKKKEDVVAEFEIGDLTQIAITLVVVGIVATYGVQIMADVQGDINATTDPDAYAAAGDGVTAVAKISDKLGLIVTIILAAVIIGILVRYLWVKT